MAAVQNGHTPHPLLKDEEVAALLLLLQMVHDRHEEGVDINRLVELIRSA